MNAAYCVGDIDSAHPLSFCVPDSAAATANTTVDTGTSMPLAGTSTCGATHVRFAAVALRTDAAAPSLMAVDIGKQTQPINGNRVVLRQ